jgi:hypothetical protein
MTTDMIQSLDQEENGLEKVIPNLKQPNFLKLTEIYSSELQEIEDCTQQVLLETKINAASGIQLDRLAQILDEDREGRGDELYRTGIRNAVFEKAKHGGIEDLISVSRIQIPQALSVVVDEYYPNTVLIFVEVEDQSTVTNGDLVVEAIKQAKQAGIEIDIGISTIGKSFRFSSLTGQTNTGRGFSSSPTGSGQGIFSQVL